MNDPETLLAHASRLIGNGRTGAARPLLMAARTLVTDNPRVAELTALLNIREGQLMVARDMLDDDVAAWPMHTGLRKLRAELRFRTDDLPGALEDAADCVIQDSHDPTAKALLGMLLLEVGQAKDAVLCLGEAVRDAPRNPGFIKALATAQEALGDTSTAASTLQSGIQQAPGDGSLRSAAVLLAVRQRNFDEAVELATAARSAGIADACTFGLLGHALSSLGRHTEAADAYQEALKLGPDDPYVRHLVAASGVVASADRAPDDYIRTIFDGYAERFEDHLISLGYRIPGLVRSVLFQYRPGLKIGQSIGPVLDLGCGTGLVGVALSDLPLTDLIGVDLSARMLENAAQKRIYAQLHTEEAGSYLRREQRMFPLIVAADVLCYFGNINQILADMAARLSIGGIVIFTVEELLNDQMGKLWMLGRQGRFAHSPAYVRDCAIQTGLCIHEIRRETLRKEGGANVPGLLVILERSS